MASMLEVEHPTLTKQELRRSIREQMRAVSPAELATWSRVLVNALQSRGELWQSAGTVALFGGLRNEPDLISDFAPWLRERGWRTVLFAMQGVELHPYAVHGPHDLKRGPLGVWEPVENPANAVPIAELTLILVPGLAFADHDGTRLGRGGGYFDRLLSRPEVTAQRLGICFEAQILPGVPHEAHDARVPSLLTERQWRQFVA